MWFSVFFTFFPIFVFAQYKLIIAVIKFELSIKILSHIRFRMYEPLWWCMKYFVKNVSLIILLGQNKTFENNHQNMRKAKAVFCKSALWIIILARSCITRNTSKIGTYLYYFKTWSYEIRLASANKYTHIDQVPSEISQSKLVPTSQQPLIRDRSIWVSWRTHKIKF